MTGQRIILALALAMVGCSDSGTAPLTVVPIDLSRPLASASPGAQQVDSQALAAAYRRGDSVPGLRSLLMLRNGVLIGERYYGGSTADTLFDVRSVTKSVMSLLVGIAIERGLISSIGEPLDSLITPPVDSVPRAAAQISVENLLTMTGGFAWDESVAGYNAWVLAPDQVEYVLERPIVDPPGQHFTYNSAAVHLLSVGISQAAGMTTEAFASQELFAELGILDHAWETDHRGFNNGGAGLALRARDLAKLGQLVLQDGASGTVHAAPAAWVHAMLQPHERLGTAYGVVSNLSYGYLWWMGDATDHHLVFAWGYRGQFIVLEPQLHLVVVATSSLDAPIAPDDEAQSVLALIVDRVIPTAR